MFTNFNFKFISTQETFIDDSSANIPSAELFIPVANIITPTTTNFLRAGTNQDFFLLSWRWQIRRNLLADHLTTNQAAKTIKDKFQECVSEDSDNEQIVELKESKKVILSLHYKPFIITALQNAKNDSGAISIETILDILNTLNIPFSSEIDEQDIFIFINDQVKNLKKYLRFFNFDATQLIKKNIDIHSMQGQLLLIQLAKVAVLNQNKYFGEDIHNFRINPYSSVGRTALTEIAKQMTELYGYSGKHLNNFGFDHTIPEHKVALIEIAKAIAEKTGKIHSHLKEIGLCKKNPEDLIVLKELANLCAMHAHTDILFYLDDFGFNKKNENDKQALIEIFKLVAKISSGSSIAMNIKKIGLNSKIPQEKQELFEIAKLALKNDIYETLKSLKNFGLDSKIAEDKQMLTELAYLAARHKNSVLIKYIDRFNFNPTIPADKQTLIDIFIHIASKSEGKKIASSVHKLRLDKNHPQERKILIQLASLAVKKYSKIAKHIRNFGFNSSIPEDKQVLVNIAKAIAKIDGEALVLNIENFDLDRANLEDKKNLIEIAKLAIQSAPKEVAKYIKNFDFDSSIQEDKQGLIEIIKSGIAANPSAIIKNIQHFNLDSSIPEDKQTLIEFAFLLAKKEPVLLALHLKKFGIDNTDTKDKKILFKIARLIAKGESRYFCQSIKYLGFKQDNPEDKAFLNEHAKKFLPTGKLAMEYFDHFGLDPNLPTDKKTLIEIAKLLAQDNGMKAAYYIKKFSFDINNPIDKKILVEIAHLAIQQDVNGTLQYLQNFGFNINHSEDKNILRNFAKLALNCNPIELVKHIQQFKLDSENPEDEKLLIKIAKKAAKQDSCLFYYYISSFNFDYTSLSHQKILLESAKLAMYNKKDGGDYLKSYHLNKNALIEVTSLKALIFISQLSVQGLEKTEEKYTRFITSLKEQYFPIAHLNSIKAFFKELHFHKELNSSLAFFDLCQKQAIFNPNLLSTLQKNYQEIKEPYNKLRFLEWAVSLAMIASISKGKRDFTNYSQLIESIASKSPALKSELTTELVIDLFNTHSFLDELRAAAEPDRKSKGQPLKHAELPCLVLAGCARKTKKLDLKQIYINFIKKIKSRHYRDFRYAKHQNLLVQTLLMIKSCSLQESEKAILIEKLGQLDIKTLLEVLQIVKDLIALNGNSYLVHLPQENLVETLRQKLEQLFQEKFQLTVENFEVKYHHSFQKWRQKEAIITYAGKLESLDEPDRSQALGFYSEFIKAVLDDAFDARRYRTVDNPHLLHIATNYPEVFEKWQQPISLDEMTIQTLSHNQIEQPLFFRIQNQIKQGLEHQHLDMNQQRVLYPHVSAFIQARQPPQFFLRQIDESLFSLNQQEGIDHKLFNQLMIEKKILELFVSEDKKSLYTTLQELKKILPSQNVFNHVDLETCLSFFNEKTSFSNEYIVTDDATANDFFLMGTEVEGSCQKIDGNPDLNIALLAYLLDGKHRNLLVKDREGKIVARAVLRLLVDDAGKPVLFQEKMYVADNNPNYAIYLRQLALAKAQALNIPLVIQENDSNNGCDFKSAVRAYAKPEFDEYVDALKDIQRGSYRIYPVVQVFA